MAAMTSAAAASFLHMVSSVIFYDLKLIEPRRIVDQNFLEFLGALRPFGEPIECLAIVFRSERLDHRRVALGGAGMRPIGAPDNAIRIGGDHGARNRRGVGVMRLKR